MLLAFHGKQDVKDRYVARVRAHRAADEIIQGTYWQNGRGCAVGCTLHSAEHDRYESELGIPTQLAYLQDRIFEGLPFGQSVDFPLAFLEAIVPGASLKLVGHQFLVWLLEDPEYGVVRFADLADKAYITRAASLQERIIAGEEVAAPEIDDITADLYAAAMLRQEQRKPSFALCVAAFSSTYLAGSANALAAAIDQMDENRTPGLPWRAGMYFQAARDKLLALLQEAPVIRSEGTGESR